MREVAHHMKHKYRLSWTDAWEITRFYAPTMLKLYCIKEARQPIALSRAFAMNIAPYAQMSLRNVMYKFYADQSAPMPRPRCGACSKDHVLEAGTPGERDIRVWTARLECDGWPFCMQLDGSWFRSVIMLSAYALLNNLSTMSSSDLRAAKGISSRLIL